MDTQLSAIESAAASKLATVETEVKGDAINAARAIISGAKAKIAEAETVVENAAGQAKSEITKTITLEVGRLEAYVAKIREARIEALSWKTRFFVLLGLLALGLIAEGIFGK